MGAALVVFGLLGRMWWVGPVTLPDATKINTATGLRDAQACVTECKDAVPDAQGNVRSVCTDRCTSADLGDTGDSHGTWATFGLITTGLGGLAVALSLGVVLLPGGLAGAAGLPRTVGLAATGATGAALASGVVFIALAPTETPALWFGGHAYLLGSALLVTVSARALTGGWTPAAEASAETPFAGDPPTAAIVRRVDRAVGLAEQVTLFSILVFLVLASFAWFLLGLLREPTAWGLLDESIDGVGVDIRYGVFLSAMVGGAFATHHKRLLSMDVVSRMIGARARAWLRVGLTLFAAEMALVFFSFAQIIARETGKEHETEHWIPAEIASYSLGIGAGLIALHLFFQIMTDLDYLLRGKTPPEPEQGVA